MNSLFALLRSGHARILVLFLSLPFIAALYAAEPGLVLPPAPHNEADGIIRVAWGNPPGVGEAPEWSYMTVDIQPAGGPNFAPTPPIAPGRYPLWCFDVNTEIDPGMGTLYGGYLYSSTDPTASFNAFLPNHPNVIQGPETWKKINYLINHRLLACDGTVPTMWEVQHAIFALFGQPGLPSPPYPSVRANVVQCLVDEANANAATWQLSCGDKVAVIYNIDVNWDASLPDVQLVFLEVPVSCASLGNYVWYDVNANGKQDGGELGVPNVQVQLYRCVDNALVATTMTDANGLYLFNGLLPNDYYVKVVAPAGYIFTSKNAAGTTGENDSDADDTGLMTCTTLSDGENDLSWDTGLYQLAAIGDRVWHDVNVNGVQDVGETGVNGVTVELYNCVGDVLVATSVTAGDGLYSFTIPPGDYYVKFTNLPAGYVFTASVAGGLSDPSDSDANTLTGKTDCTTIVSGENDTTWDAGIYIPASLGNRVWFDTNANGVQDPGELGVDNVTVELYACAGDVLLASTTTTGGGLYGFKVFPGDYYVKFSSLPVGYKFTTNVAGSASDPTDSDANAVSGKTDCTTIAPGENDDSWDAGLVAIPPLTLQCAGGTGQVGMAYNSSLVVAGGTPPYTFSIAAGSLPPGLSLNGTTGAITGTPTAAGAFNFTAKVVDSMAGTAFSTTSNCSITVGEAPCIPSTFAFSGNTSTWGSKGNIRTYTVNGISVKVSAFSRAKSGSNPWDPAYLGAYSGGLGVTDESEGWVSGNSHTVDNIGRHNFVLFEFSQPVVVNRAFLGYVVADSDLSVWAGNATDPYNNHLTLSDSLLSGLTRQDNTTESGSPRWANLSSEMSGNVLVISAWLDDTSAEDEFKIGALDICQPPSPVALACVADGTGIAGFAYSSSLVATGGVPGYTFSITSGSLPPGLTLNTSTGAITGTPTTVGTFAFTAKVVDSTGATGEHTTSKQCSIKIDQKTPPKVTLQCVSKSTGKVGEVYSASFDAGGGTPPYTFSLVSGTLPNGLTLNTSTGALTGTPTKAGVFNFSVKVVDSKGNTGSNAATVECCVTISGPPDVKLVCASQGSGVVGTAYSSSLTASGGTPGYTFYILSGQLPKGLTLKQSTGLITGTPTHPGTYCFTVKVIDSKGEKDTVECCIKITAPLCVQSTFAFSGSTSTSGSKGNTRTYTVNGISVKVSAFSRAKSGSNPWDPAYLGAYSGGLGVTDESEGSGGGNSHTVDNVGRHNFVLFEFSQPVVVNRAFLGYVVADSDLSIWIGNASNPFNNHLTLSDSLLTGFKREDNTTESGNTRWADFNSSQTAGNVLVIAGWLDDTSAEDEFKIGALDICVGQGQSDNDIPSPWQTKDIGSVEKKGFASYSGGTFTVAGSGNDLGGWDGKDEFRFLYQTGSSNCTVIAKVQSIQDTQDGATAGVMIRDSLGSDAKFAAALVTPENGILQQTRSSTGGNTSTKTDSGPTAPYWVKIVRDGHTFTMYRSSNGSSWTQIDQPVTIYMGSSVYIGLVTNSRKDGVICTATFSNVTASP